MSVVFPGLIPRKDDTYWTKETTDYLFVLCRKFDLRFPVISDRYCLNGVEKSIEDIKSRYFTVCKALLISRNAEESELKQYEYDYGKASTAEHHRILTRKPENASGNEIWKYYIKELQRRQLYLHSVIDI